MAIANVPVSGGTAGGLNHEGSWDANANSPDLSAISASIGDFWIVSVTGDTSLGGITDWHVNDWAVKSSTGWFKVDNSERPYIDDILPVTAPGQTVFTLSETPADSLSLVFTINGNTQIQGVHYTLVAKTITWLNSFLLAPGDQLLAHYYGAGEAPPTPAGAWIIPSGTTLPVSPDAGEIFWLTTTSLIYRRNDLNTAWEVIAVGAGAGDMLKAVYDPITIEDDVFDADNHVYSNAVSGLSALNTQDAIDELASEIDDLESWSIITDVLPVLVPDTTSFILSQVPEGIAELTFSVNGGIQTPTSDYTLAGQTITWVSTDFTIDPGDEVIAHYRKNN